MITSVMTMRQQLTQSIEELPGEVLPELANFIHYLHFKSHSNTSPPAPVMAKEDNFLLAIAGLGRCEEDDLSERDEEILAKEISPLSGWTLKAEENQ